MKRKCDQRGPRVTKQTIEQPFRPKIALFSEKYLFIGEKRQSNPKCLRKGEPVLRNPNSFENLEVILKELKSNLGIRDAKQWSFVGCDVANRLVEQDKKSYDWVSLVPGLGHLRMNQIKALFKVFSFL